ncbi:MAG: sigma-70 family RNA polymerase sigma factor [Anaerolineae bacterium]|nr:sigma-70 family RNA polymerase sigma factor [Anaerolineae bacterium]
MLQDSWNESTLVKAAQKGSLDAFNALVLHYQTRVFNLAGYILKDDAAADDAAQEAFIRAYQNLDTFKGGSFQAWLLRTVSNLCYDELRRHKRRPTTSWEDFGEMEQEANPHLADRSPTPEQILQHAELRDLLDKGLHELPVDQRLVIVLIDEMDCTYEEVMHITKAPLGTVKSRLYRARAHMRGFMQLQSEILPSHYLNQTEKESEISRAVPELACA